jgi:hypothetical protein
VTCDLGEKEDGQTVLSIIIDLEGGDYLSNEGFGQNCEEAEKDDPDSVC